MEEQDQMIDPMVEKVEKNEKIEGADSEPATPETPETPEVPAYEPNFKYRFDDKDFELDERLRPVVTSKESEEYVRDLVTKAHGLDLSKSRAEERERKYQEEISGYSDLRSHFDRVTTNIEKLKALKVQDFGTFQKAWEIPDQTVLARAAEILKVHGDPAAQAQADRMYADRIDMLRQEDRMQSESRVQQQVNAQLHEMKMANAMAVPQVQTFQQQYDSRLGPGAFAEEVRREGSLAFAQGRYLDPQVAVAQTHQKLSKLMGSIAPPTPVQQPAAASHQPAPQQEPQATPRAPIPNVGSGRSGTPIKKRPGSIAELRKLAATFDN